MRRRLNFTSFFVYAGVIFVLLYFFIRFGIQTAVDIAFFLTSRNHKTNSVTQKKVIKGTGLITEPYLLEVPSATNSAQITLSGKANADNEITLFVNNSQVSQTTADFDGNYEFTLDLPESKNQIYVQAKDPYSEKTLDSAIYEISCLQNPPKLEVTNPVDGKKYYSASLNIEGSTDSEVFVKVNGVSVVVRADNTFSYPVTLNNGENTFTVTATDVANNVTTKEIKIQYIQ